MITRRLMIIAVWTLLASPLLAANIYVRSTDGSDADNGSTWALAKATLTGAAAIDAAGDTIYVSDNHAESTAGAVTLAWAGTAASPTKILCVDDSAEPPTALATTGTVSTTGANALTLSNAANAFIYVYGLTFQAGDGANTANIAIPVTTAGNCKLFFESCGFTLNNTSTSSTITTGGGSGTCYVTWKNCTATFGSTSQGINHWSTIFEWLGGSTAGSVPTTLFSSAYYFDQRIVGVDLSALGSGKNLVNIAYPQFGQVGLTQFQDCKLGSSVSVTTGTVARNRYVRLLNSDSADTNYRYQKSCYEGTITQESTIVRTGGATDGTTPVSRKLVSSANTTLVSPLASDPIYFWNETTGSTVTVTVECVTDNVTLTDAEAWVEVEYLGTSGFPLASTITDRAADILATPANQTTSSETWTTTGLTTPVKQKLSVTFTPQEKGLVRARVMVAKASTTVYVCPEILTGAGRSFMTCEGGYMNEAVPAGGGSSPTSAVGIGN